MQFLCHSVHSFLASSFDSVDHETEGTIRRMRSIWSGARVEVHMGWVRKGERVEERLEDDVYLASCD